MKFTNYYDDVDENINGNEDELENVEENEYVIDNKELRLGNGELADARLVEALENIVNTGTVSLSFIERTLGIPMQRASIIYDQLEELGFVSGHAVLISRTEFYERFGH